MGLLTKKVLITVKTYPNPSKKYGETVCCAGIDLETSQWIRLYPIPYRDLEESQKFQKYTILKVQCRKAPNDHRIESYRVDSDSIQVIEQLDTRNKWERRKQIIMPTVCRSFCELLREVPNQKSLGMFKPWEISFSAREIKLNDSTKRDACYSQLSFFDKKKDAIEEIPFHFYYHFKCFDRENCPGHKLPILDWEIGQSYRRWRYQYKTTKVLLEKIQEKWLSIVSDSRDSYLFVGNMQRFSDQFMVLGVFYPPK